MSRPAIIVDGLSKLYRLSGAERRPDSLREALTSAIASPLRRFRELREAREEEEEGAGGFWALRDVSFEVQPGEVIGIIGRNGAGKSTILKILSRVVEPTEGSVRLRGRTASLLEVGTGFHPDLSGRENVYLNGSILGMSRAEIGRKFDEIVAFSEIERFIDTPVKRYSSGMQVRLAFAVAAHLEPEILILDEVLAVGDTNFQNKCLGKMKDVAGHGRTVLFVSHSMNSVTRLCQRAILLQKGRVIADGSADEVTRIYLQSDLGTMSSRSWPDPTKAPGNDIARLRSIRIRDEEGETVDVADIRKPVGIEMVFEVLRGGNVLIPNLHFHNDEGICVFIIQDNAKAEWARRPRPPGLYTSVMWIPGNFLAEGMLVVSPALSTHDPVTIHFFERDAVAFQVVDSHEGDSVRGDYTGSYPGVVRPRFGWETSYDPMTNPVAVSGEF